MSKPKFSNEDLTRWKREVNPAPIIGKRIKLRRENAEYVGCCPDVYHKKNTGHSDTNPSFKIYKLDDGTWAFKCFSCSANGNVYQFVQKFDGISFTKAVEKVLAEAGVSGWEDGAEQIDTSLPEQEHKAHVVFPLKDYAQSVKALASATDAQAWLEKRGISMETARKFHLGFIQSADAISQSNAWVKNGWVLFPTLSADGQTVTAIKYRSLTAKKKMIAGKENSGILRAPNTSTTLFNIQAVTPQDDVWVCEGEPDTLVLAQAGLVAVGYPMAGYKPTDEECEILSSAKRRFLAGDNDAAGKTAMDALQKRLGENTFCIQWPNKRKDANDVLTNECHNDKAAFKTLVEDLKDRVTQTKPISIKRKASKIAMKQIRWLWPDRIPLGKITLFAGNPDNGKSLASTSVAAICSTGGVPGESPFTCEPSDVLMLIGEDDADDTATPRLAAARADLNRIEFLEAVRKPQEENHEVRLDFDIPAIEDALIENSNLRLIVIDPISNYLGDISMVSEQDVRSILIPLKRLAEKYNAAIVIVMHLNKKSDLDAISRVGGAMAFIGVARCSWLFARDVQEDAPEGEDVTPAEKKKADSFSMLRIKNNLVSCDKAGLAYHIETCRVRIEGEDIFTPYVIWDGPVEGSADQRLSSSRRPSKPSSHRGVGRPSTIPKAVKWLESTLQDGEPHYSKQVIKDAKDEANISADSIREAYAHMVENGLAKKPSKSRQGDPKWYWQIEPMNAGSGTGAPQQSDLVAVEAA